MESEEKRTDAIMAYKKSLRFHPAYIPAIHRFALLYLREGVVEKALLLYGVINRSAWLHGTIVSGYGEWESSFVTVAQNIK